MENKLLREVRFLKYYSLLLTAVLVLVLTLSFTRKQQNTRFTEIDAERINILEKDGTLKMVISNQERQHPGLYNGKMDKPRERPAGIMFFNSAGYECGGLIYDAKGNEAGMAFSMDQYRNDQIMQLNYRQSLSTNEKTYGLKLWDRPDDFILDRQAQLLDSLGSLHNDVIMQKEIKKLADDGLFGTERLFVGKSFNGDIGLFIRDGKGKPRIKLYVDKTNTPRIEFLGENGRPVPVK